MLRPPLRFSPSSTTPLPHSWRFHRGCNPTLGDKIQRLGMRRPGFLAALEMMVDAMLAKLDAADAAARRKA